MFGPALRRVAAALHRGGVLSPTGAAYAAPDGGVPACGADVSPPTLSDLVAAAPAMRAVLLERARMSGLLAGVVAGVVAPAWTVIDRVVSPHEAASFLLVRLLCDVPVLLLTLALWRLPVGRRRPELLTFGALAVVQLEVSWIVSRAASTQAYVLGITLALFGSGCVLVVRPRCTAALILTTWVGLAVALVAAGRGVSPSELVGSLGYIGTASLIALVAHLHRHATTLSELSTRLRLEREQERSRVLLAELNRLSHEDPLTGLANRRRWDAELAAVCTEARGRGASVSVLVVDLDHFKRINDLYGHPGGDEALRRISGLLSAAVRGDDLVARLGGDEFAVLLPGAAQERAVALAEQVRRAAAGLLVEGFAPGEVSLSVGVAAAVGTEAYPVELMSRADEQLYRAKITRNAVGVRAPAR